MTKEPSRKKPRLEATIDRDIFDWLTSEASAHRLKVSQYVNQVLGGVKDSSVKKRKKRGRSADTHY